jgi:hypothetical protein
LSGLRTAGRPDLVADRPMFTRDLDLSAYSRRPAGDHAMICVILNLDIWRPIPIFF